MCVIVETFFQRLCVLQMPGNGYAYGRKCFMRPTVNTTVKRIVAVFAAAVIVVFVTWVGTYAAELAAQEVSYDWYTSNPNADTFEISSGGDLRGLAELVNGTADTNGDGKAEAAVSFEGKTIKQTSRAINLMSEEFTPIGTEAHPFEGTFDGNAGIDAGDSDGIRGLVITEGVAYLGLFGYCGSHSTLENIAISPATGTTTPVASSITLADESEANVTTSAVFHDIGTVVGYTAGSIVNCTSQAPIAITSNRQATANEPVVVANVGGLAGTVVQSVSTCSSFCDLAITAPSLASDSQDCVVANIGGLIGTLGAVSDDGRTSSAGAITDCFYGLDDSSLAIGGLQTEIKVCTTGVGGLDRFGVQKEATSLSVGGIVGYSFGSISDCINYGFINTNSADVVLRKNSQGNERFVEAGNLTPSRYPIAEEIFVIANGGSGVGGICGSLRSSGVGLSNQARNSGGSADNAISVYCCFNEGMIVGLANTGGIVGSAGTYADIDACRNGKVNAASGTGVSDDGGHVVTTRWNKPMTGGICGSTSSNVSNCSNLNEIENIQTGYYTAGIVGSLGSPTDYTSECFACFNTGQVHVVSTATKSYREAGIVGNNGGYVHDCVMRSGSVLAHDDDDTTYPNAAIGDDSWGMWSNIKFFSSTELKTSDAAAVLNASHAQDVLKMSEDEWVYWYIATEGYPTLNIWDEPQNRTQLTSANVKASCVQLAEYAGLYEAIPTLIVTYTGTDGNDVILVQNVDYYVIPQAGATEMTGSETPYKASIIGIGNYVGTVYDVCNYGIGPCDLSNCDVSVSAEKYNFDVCVYPDEVYVMNPAGALLDSSEFRYEIFDSSTYIVTSASQTSGVVFDSEGYVSWDGGATRTTVASQHDKLCSDLTGIDYILYNMDGNEIFKVENGVQYIVDSQSGRESEGYGLVWYKPAREGVTGGGLAGYIVKVTPKESAATIKSDSWTTGQYVISALDFYQDCVIEEVNVEVPSVDGTASTTETWYWNSEKSKLYKLDANGDPITNADGSLKQADITFTGAPVEPTITVTYTKEDGTKVIVPNDQTLGYYLVYGDPYTTAVDLPYTNRDATPLDDDDTSDLANLLKDHERAAVTIRSATKTRFDNYVHTYFTINPRDMEECTLYIGGSTEYNTNTDPNGDRQLATYAYRGGYSVQPSLDLMLCGNTLIRGTDYSVTYDNNVDPTTEEAIEAFYANGDTSGLASVTIDGLGNVVGSTTIYFAIAEGKSLTEAGYSVQPIGDQQYNFEYPVQVLDGITLINDDDAVDELVEGIDYTVSYADNVKVGVAQVTVKGINGYTGQLQTSFNIVPFDVSDPANADRIYIDYGKDSWATDGIPWGNNWGFFLRARPIIDWDTGECLPEGGPLWCNWTAVHRSTGGTYSYDYMSRTGDANKLVIGTYDVVFEPVTYGGLDYNLTGTLDMVLTIVKADVADLTWFDPNPVVYTGEPYTPWAQASCTQSVVDGSGDWPTTDDDDFTVTYSDNVQAGEAHYTVKAKSTSERYTGTYVGSFNITKFNVADADVTVLNQVYTGEAVTPAVTVSGNGATYTEGVDFTVEYANNVDKGTASVVIEGIGSCEGTKTVTFKIGNSLDISQAVVEPIVEQLYTGEAVTPAVRVIYDGTELVEGTHYSVKYEDNIELGTATVTITGLGVYAGTTTTATFDIVSVRNIMLATYDSIPDQIYTGDAIEPAVELTYGGVALVKNVDYTLEYRRNVKAGQDAKAVITGIDTFEGTIEIPFNIVVGEGSISSIGDDISAVDGGTSVYAAAFSLSVAREIYPAGVTGVIIVDALDTAAQMAVAPLSQQLGLPLLLTSEGMLPSDAVSFLRTNGACTSALIIGGEDAVSYDVEATLADSLGMTVERLVPESEQALAIDMAERLAAAQVDSNSPQANAAVAVNPASLEDAAAAASYAASCGMPVYYTLADGTLDEATAEALSAYKLVVVAGDYLSVDAIVDQEIESPDTDVERIFGATRYAANAVITSYSLQNGCAADGAVVVNTPYLSSQLSAITLCAARGVPLVLAASQSMEGVAVIAAAPSPAYEITLCGGAQAFSDDLTMTIRETLGW